MRLSVETHWLREKFNDETALRMIRAAGFDAFDYSFYWMRPDQDVLGEDYQLHARHLRQLADELGLQCNQAHAPLEFYYTNQMNETDPLYLRIVRSIEFASILGADNIIIHAVPGVSLPADVDFYAYNRAYYLSFLPYCRRYHISVSVENLYVQYDPVLGDPMEMQAFVQSLESPYFNICMDLGHSGKTGFDVADSIRKMDPALLKALHVHDNDKKDDYHWLPYEGQLNWHEIAGALGEIGYQGDFTYEIFGFLKQQDPGNLQAALNFAEATGRFIIQKIQKKRLL